MSDTPFEATPGVIKFTGVSANFYDPYYATPSILAFVGVKADFQTTPLYFPSRSKGPAGGSHPSRRRVIRMSPQKEQEYSDKFDGYFDYRKIRSRKIQNIRKSMKKK